MNKEAALPLAPEVSEITEGYWEGSRKGELRVQTCDDCDAQRFPEAPACQRCLSPEFTWRAVSGRGKVWSWINMHQKAFRSYADDVPYLCAFIELEEGLHLISSIVDPPVDLACDVPVQVEFVELDNDRSAHVFRVVTHE